MRTTTDTGTIMTTGTIITTSTSIITNAHHDHAHREADRDHPPVTDAPLPERARDLARKVFQTLAESEAAILETRRPSTSMKSVPGIRLPISSVPASRSTIGVAVLRDPLPAGIGISAAPGEMLTPPATTPARRHDGHTDHGPFELVAHRRRPASRLDPYARSCQPQPRWSAARSASVTHAEQPPNVLRATLLAETRPHPRRA